MLGVFAGFKYNGFLYSSHLPHSRKHQVELGSIELYVHKILHKYKKANLWWIYREGCRRCTHPSPEIISNPFLRIFQWSPKALNVAIQSENNPGSSSLPSPLRISPNIPVETNIKFSHQPVLLQFNSTFTSVLINWLTKTYTYQYLGVVLLYIHTAY